MEISSRFARYSQEGNIAILTLQQGENRFNPTTIAEFHCLLDKVLADPTNQALIVTGEDKFFSNGLDQRWMAQNADSLLDFLFTFQKLVARVLSFPIPTIAAINGHMFAGGMMFALAFDERIMREDRGLACMPEVDLGMPLSRGMISILEAKISSSQVLRDIILFGKRYSPREALVSGFLDQIVASETLLPTALDAARKWAPKGQNRVIFGSLKSTLYSSALSALGNFGTLKAVITASL